MPCNSDYMNQTQKEKLLQETAQFYVYLLKKMGVKTSQIDPALRQAADTYYCTADFVPQLCDYIRSMTPEDVESIISNAHDRTARRLADWWEDHKKADKKRK